MVSGLKWGLSIVALLLTSALYVAYLNADILVLDAFTGQSLDILNDKFRQHKSYDPQNRDLTYFQNLVKPILLRLTLAMFAVGFLVFGLIHFEKSRRHIFSYFQHAQAPETLTLFRIVVFALLLWRVMVTPSMFFSGLSPHLLVAPIPWQPLIHFIPINPLLAELAFYGLITMSVFGFIGLFTRTVTWIALFLSIYYFGIPQFYGKVNHCHHLIWFLMILAVSPGADIWSVDAWRKRGKMAFLKSIAPAKRYALPIRIVWLLVGIIYFFPGAWKVLTSGLAWFSDDSFRHWIYFLTHLAGKDTVVLQIDQYPLLLTATATVAVLFELSFIFAVFSERMRGVWAVAGILFHLSIGVIGDIWFLDLWLLYFVFFDVGKVRWISHSRANATSIMLFVNESKAIRPIALVGGILLCLNIAFGAGRMVEAWPFSCYPLFATTGPETIRQLSFHGRLNGSDSLELDIDLLREKIGAARLKAMIDDILEEENKDDTSRKIRSLLSLLPNSSMKLNDFKAIYVYERTMTMGPGKAAQRVVENRLLLSWRNEPSQSLPQLARPTR